MDEWPEGEKRQHGRRGGSEGKARHSEKGEGQPGSYPVTSSLIDGGGRFKSLFSPVPTLSALTVCSLQSSALTALSCFP